MSYLHCPTCKRAYNVATSSHCPNCPVTATLVDPAEDIVAAAESLARAMARATPDERDDAMGRMDRLALPAPGAKPVTFHGAMIRSIREALEPTMAPPPPKPQSLVTAIALSLIERSSFAGPRSIAEQCGAWIDRVVDHPRAVEMRERASRLVARKAPRLWNRVRSLAA